MTISPRLSSRLGITRLIRFSLRVLRHLMYWLVNWERKIGIGSVPEPEQETRVVLSTQHDMVAYADEPYYLAQYWYWIEKALDSVSLPNSSVCLDLGCGQGRLTMPLARKYNSGAVVGIDLSAQAIASAKKYAAELGITNVDYREGNIHQVVNAWPSTSVDVVLMTEVTLFYPRWREDLPELERILKPGGVLAIAFRPQYYDMLNIIKHRMWEQVDLLLNQRSGPLYSDRMEFTWQKSGEICRLFAEGVEMELMHLVGIGCCSGIEYDPHGSIVRPSQLDKDERERLMQLELSVGAEIPDAGRYMLAIARKKHGSVSLQI